MLNITMIVTIRSFVGQCQRMEMADIDNLGRLYKHGHPSADLVSLIPSERHHNPATGHVGNWSMRFSLFRKDQGHVAA